jgi:alkaline phosphatase
MGFPSNYEEINELFVYLSMTLVITADHSHSNVNFWQYIHPGWAGTSHALSEHKISEDETQLLDDNTQLVAHGKIGDSANEGMPSHSLKCWETTGWLHNLWPLEWYSAPQS